MSVKCVDCGEEVHYRRAHYIPPRCSLCDDLQALGGRRLLQAKLTVQKIIARIHSTPKRRRRIAELEALLAGKEGPPFQTESGVCVDPLCSWPYHTHSLGLGDARRK